MFKQSEIKRNRKQTKQRSITQRVGREQFVTLAVTVASFFLLGSVFAGAQTFSPPANPAPNNVDLNSFTSSDFVQLASGSAHTIDGQLVVASSTDASVIIGDFANNSAVSAYAGVTTEPIMPPSLADVGISGAGLYAYAEGAGQNIGAFGLGTGVNPVGVFAKGARFNTLRILDGRNPDGSDGAAVGRYSSITVDTGGLPIMAYYDSTSDRLRYLRCADEFCSSLMPGSPRTLNDATKKGGKYVSLAIDAEGYPVISYTDDDNHDVRFIRCADLDCSSLLAHNEIYSGGSGLDGRYTSLVIDKADNPIISFFDDAVNELHVVKCNNKTCSAPLTHLTTSYSDTVGQYTSIAIASNGKPIIAFLNVSDNQLLVSQCNDVNCTALTSPNNLTDAHQDISMAIGTDGKPIIVYANSSDDVYVAHCANIECTSLDTPTRVTDVTDNGDDTSIVIGKDGLPVISYYNWTDTALVVVHCTNVECTSFTPNPPITVDRGGNSGYDSDIAVDLLGHVIVSHYDEENGKKDLKYAHCSSTSCEEAGFSASFWGPMRIANGDLAGTLTTQDAIASPNVVALSSVLATPALYGSNGIAISGKFKDGLYGYANNSDNALVNYGIYGNSTVNKGFAITNTLSVAGAENYGAKGTTLQKTDKAGVYGWSIKGNGVRAVVGSASNLFSVEGNATGIYGVSDYTAGVYGRGGAFAGLFEGDVVLPAGSKFYIGSQGFTDVGLCNMLKWCVANGSCPDPYIVSGQSAPLGC